MVLKFSSVLSVKVENWSNFCVLVVALQVSEGIEAKANGPDYEASQSGNFSSSLLEVVAFCTFCLFM